MRTPEVDAPYKATLGDTWAMVGTWLVLAIIAGTTQGISIVLRGLGQFFTGDIAGLEGRHYGYERLLPTVLGAIVVALPLMMAASWLAESIYGKATSNYLQRRTMGLRKFDGAAVYVVKATVVQDVVDELFGRVFLLGLLTIPLSRLIGQGAAFYTLFALSTVPQTLRYRHMYRDEREQMQLARLWPQFLGSVILAVVFVRFGLIASVSVHLLYNLLIASLDRFTADKRRGAWRVIIGSGLLGVTGLAGLIAIGMPPRQIIHGHFTTFDQYLWGVLLFSGTLMLVLELLLYDPEPLEAGFVRRVPAGPSISEAIYKGNFRPKVDEIIPSTAQLFAGEIGNAILATAVTCFWVLLASAMMHYWSAARVHWIAMVSAPAVLFYLFGSRSVSVNGAARLVWENGPVIILIISAFPTIGFWPAAGVSVCREVACHLIRRPIRYAGMVTSE